MSNDDAGGEAAMACEPHDVLQPPPDAVRIVPLSPPRARGGLSGWQQRRVADFIEMHLAETVRLPALAAIVNLSPYHFARAFKQSFGLPPHRYHLCRRIARAKALLREPDGSVTAVAVKVGFAETSSFSAAFRKLTGLTPSRYRAGLMRSPAFDARQSETWVSRY
jgi:AraC family transcriptional regulator